MSLQEPLLELLSSLDLEELRSAGRFPDWLGHLGLYLRYTEQAEREYGTATRHLVPQLMALTSSGAAAGLGSLELDPLSWRHLQLVEEDLKARARRPRAAQLRRRGGEVHVRAADGRF